MLARPDLDETGKILTSAADHLEKHNWFGGKNRGGNVCLMTSIWSINPLATEAADRVTHYLGFKTRVEAVTWNDSPERTKEEVICALREAAYFRD